LAGPLSLSYFFADYFRYHYHFHNIDLLDVFHPFMQTFHRYLARGVLLLWNPLVGIGHPAVVWGHYPLSPVTPVFLAFGYNDHTVNASLVLAFGVTVATFFLFARLSLTSRPLALVAALAWLGMPLVGQYMLHIVHLSAIAWAPLIVWAVHRYASRPSFGRWLTSAVALNLSLVGAKAELWVISVFLFAFAWVFFKPISRAPGTGPFLHMLAGVLCVGFAGLGYLFPAYLVYDAIASSPRLGFPHSLENLVKLEFYVLQATALLTSPYGQTLLASFVALVPLRWLARAHPTAAWLLLGSLIAGFLRLSPAVAGPAWLPALPVAGTVLALLLSRRSLRATAQLSSPAGLFWRLVFLCWVYLYFFQAIDPHERRELYDDFAPYTFVLVLLLHLGALQARGRLHWFGLVGFLAVILLRYQVQQVLIQGLGIVWHPGRDNYLIFLFLISVALPGLTRLFAGIRFLPGRSVRRAARVLGGAAALVLVLVFLNGVLFFNPRFVLRADRLDFTAERSAALHGFLHARSAGEGHRILPMPDRATLEADRWSAGFVFNPNVLQAYDLAQASFYDSSPATRFTELINAVNHQDRFRPGNPIINHSFSPLLLRFFPPEYNRMSERELYDSYTYLRLLPRTVRHDLLALLGVRWVLTESPLDSAGYADLRVSTDADRSKLRPVFQFEFRGVRGTPSKTYFIYETSSEPPLVHFYGLGQMERVADLAGCVRRLATASFDGTKTVLLDGNWPPVLSGDQRPARGGGAFRVTRHHPHRALISGEALEPGLLLWSQGYSPHWRARVDGREVPTLPVNCAFVGVFVEPGAHRVEFAYRPMYLTLTAVITALWWLAVSGYGVWCCVSEARTRRRLAGS
jgi:hypothetical protein